MDEESFTLTRKVGEKPFKEDFHGTSQRIDLKDYKILKVLQMKIQKIVDEFPRDLHRY